MLRRPGGSRLDKDRSVLGSYLSINEGIFVLIYACASIRYLRGPIATTLRRSEERVSHVRGLLGKTCG